MNPVLRNILIGVVMIILIFEFGYQYVAFNKEAELANPVDKNGYIKDGETVSFKEEEKLAVKSFPDVTEKEYADNMLYAFSQCLMFAESIENNGYECIENNVSNEIVIEKNGLKNENKGQAVYDLLAADKQITNVYFQYKKSEEDVFTYDVQISLDRDSVKTNYQFQIVKRQITSIDVKEEESN